ncbi:MAG: SDR family NAD(P)-dependent oxidoreductase, partial [Pseudomonadota bacterium]
MGFENKTVWITGASSGIGEALALAFASRGAHIVLSGRREEALRLVANNLETDGLVLPFEATNFAILQEKVEAAWDWKGRVDILVNN